MQLPDEWKAQFVVGAGDDVGAIVGAAETVGATVTVGAGVGNGARHTRHPAAGYCPSDDHEMLVDELTATQSGPEVCE